MQYRYMFRPSLDRLSQLSMVGFMLVIGAYCYGSYGLAVKGFPFKLASLAEMPQVVVGIVAGVIGLGMINVCCHSFMRKG